MLPRAAGGQAILSGQWFGPWIRWETCDGSGAESRCRFVGSAPPYPAFRVALGRDGRPAPPGAADLATSCKAALPSR